MPETSQNFQIDIDKIYNDFIKEIDAHRSLVSITSDFVQNLNKFDETTVNSLKDGVKIGSTPQESRLHCFFRLIGFPVVSENKDSSDNYSYYNPGLDNTREIIVGAGKKLTLSEKIKIANNPIKGFKDFSIARENYLNNIKKIWSVQPSTITASALALSSSTDTRSFSESIKDDNPFEFNNENYTVTKEVTVGKYRKKIKELVDKDGHTPDDIELLKSRSHFIKPFIVDARIDFVCSPASRVVAVPFVFSKNNLRIDDNNFVKRPLIEKIISERLTSQNNKKTSTSEKYIQEYISTSLFIKDQDLITKIVNDINSISDRPIEQFKKYTNIIVAMCRALAEAKNNIKIAQTQYYYLPRPSTDGPENNSDITPIIISNKLSSESGFITDTDKSIIESTLVELSNQFNSQVLQINGTPDIGEFAFDSFQLTFNNDTSEALGNKVKDNLEKLTKQRKEVLTKANDALRVIEIITGEFSGLGLCDIIAIMAALYTMPINSLLGFLDADAFDRMIIFLGLQSLKLTNVGIFKAQTDFIKNLKDFYNIMDNINAAYEKRAAKNT